MPKRLQSLSIRGFRAIDALEIPKLSDINLFVGKNSTGKTTILEAIRLLQADDLRSRLYRVLADREEYNLGRRHVTTSTGMPITEVALNALFTGRPELSEYCDFTVDGGQNGPSLRVQFVWLRVERGDDASVRYLPSSSPDIDDSLPGLKIDRGDGVHALLPLDRFHRTMNRRILRDESEGNIVYLPSSGMSMEDVGRMWDSVALTDDEDGVVEALRIIAPTLEKLVMVQSPETRSDRLLMAKVSQFSGPVPFKSLGEGASHLLSVALALIRARDGALLIDEIATGIHYSVQSALWTMISQQSAKGRVQVFATTHSLDCVRALRTVDQSNTNAEATLFRIESSNRGLRAVTFSADELSVIDDEEIEVR